MGFIKKYRIGICAIIALLLIWVTSIAIFFPNSLRYNVKYTNSSTGASIIFKRSGVFITKDSDNKELDRGTYAIDGKEFKLKTYSGSTVYGEIVYKETVEISGSRFEASESGRTVYFIILIFISVISLFLISGYYGAKKETPHSPKPPTDQDRITALEKEIEELKKNKSE